MTYFRNNIIAMPGYQPGEQPPLGSKVIKLNSNENPYPPSPSVFKALHQLDSELLRRYPDPTAARFRQSVSQVLGVPADWLLVGNGSDDLLNILVRACVASNQKLVYPTPTYVLYRTLAQIQGVEPIEVPYDQHFNLPLEPLIEANGAITFVASPNSPSGTVTPIELLDKLASHLPGILAIDEAYVDFADNNALGLTQKYDNVIVLRTLSKGYSLAGLRLGFAVANPDLIAELNKVKDSYSVDAIACVLGAAAIEDQRHKITNVERIKVSRIQLTHDLEKLGFRVWPSQANFLLVQSWQNNAEHLYQALKHQGILVRYFKQPGLEDKLRISVGTDEQNTRLCQLLAQLAA